jgi:hypothetical protein
MVPAMSWFYTGNPLTTRIDWKPTFIGASVTAAQYRLLLPHILNNIYYDANSIISEIVDVPIGWVPTLAVDPLNARAVQQFYNAGPRAGGTYEDLNMTDTIRTSFNVLQSPVTYWKQSGNFYTLTGLGVTFGYGPVGGTQ